MHCMRKTWLRTAAVVVGVILSGCAGMGGPTASGPAPATGASARANAAADTATYKTISYANAATKGPAIIVLPGEVKSNNATFTQRYFPNNIADYAELELSQANFQVLDRANLGSVLREIELAYNLGGCPRKTRPALSAIVAVGEA
jgi:curli biogenesis system outer membrane secretion channel CsgG